MAWIKRNLFFVSEAVVALALMGFAFVFGNANYHAKDKAFEELGTKYTDVKALNEIKPPPSDANLKLVREQQAALAKVSQQMLPHFKRIPPIPDPGTRAANDQEFATALHGTVEQLRRDAARANVVTPTNYSFTFTTQMMSLKFTAPGPLAVQLGEIKAICDVIYASRANFLDRLARERVCVEDKGFADYLESQTVTNELAAIAPYQVELRCFSSDLGKLLAGFANSAYPILVRRLNLESISSPLGAAPAPPAGVAGRGGAVRNYTTVIDENLVKVTLWLDVVKLKDGIR